MQAHPVARAPGGQPLRGSPIARLLALAVIVGAGLLGVLGLSALAGGGSSETATPSGSLAGSIASPPTPSASPTATASATVAATPTLSPSPGATPTATAGGTSIPVAPTSAEGFRLRKTAIDIAFPMAATVRYRYVDDFLVPRDGITRRYNHARGVTSSGRLLRAHDGVDIRAKLGTRIRAAFSGTVIDPATRWQPWEPERYGNIVVIVSDEPTSLGYAALYAHLSSSRVEIGDRVERGQVIGRLGTTGNAVGTPPHVHVELRAPFRIPVREGGRNRRVDAFDPYPSLVAADPKRQD
jgi:murein DD-endopeptidase MepM/ murein hydrolase activator NlpD